jgi:hypothetical protein
VKLTVWKRIVMAGMLSVSMAVLPLISPLDAQQPGAPPTTDRRTVATPGKFEVKRDRALSPSNDCMATCSDLITSAALLDYIAEFDLD